MSFSVDLDRLSKRRLRKLTAFIVLSGFKMFGQIMERTPVDTGRLRGNWQTTISNPASGELDVTSSNIAQAQLTATVNGVTIRDTISFYKQPHLCTGYRARPQLTASTPGHGESNRCRV